eukprot:gene7048-11211_t
MSKRGKFEASRFSSPLPEDATNSKRGATIIIAKEKNSKSEEIILKSREKEKDPKKRKSGAPRNSNTGSLQLNRSSTQIKSENEAKQTKQSVLSTSKEKKFDPSKFEIITEESLILNPELNRALNEFACHELRVNSFSPLEFINGTIQLSFLEKKEDIIALAKDIVDTFILENSPKEIFLTKKKREKFMKEYEMIKTDEGESEISFIIISFEGLFEEFKQEQYTEVFRDVVPRFIRSKKTLNLLSKYLDDPNVIRSKQTAKFPYENDDFKRQYVTQMDFDFMKDLSKDDLNWELIDCSSGELMVYFSDIDVLQKVDTVQKTNLIKYEIVLNAPFEKVVSVLSPSDMILEYSPNCKEFKLLNERSYEEIKNSNKTATNIIPNKSCSVAMFDIRLNFPMTTLRKYPITYASNYQVSKNNKEQLQIIWKPSVHESFGDDKFQWAMKSSFKDEDNSTNCYFMFDFCGHLYEAIDANRTKYSQIHCGDLGGWTQNSSLMRLVLKKRGTELRKNLVSHISKFGDTTFENSKETMLQDPIGKIVFESIETYKKEMEQLNGDE